MAPRKPFRSLVIVIFASLWIAAYLPADTTGRGVERWLGTWATAVVARSATPQPSSQPLQGGRTAQAGSVIAVPLNFKDRTLRQIVHTSIGGERVRVVISNAFGTVPLVLGAALVARRDKGAAIIAQSGHALTFSGHGGMTIPPGATALSDPLTFVVPAFADLAIDVYLPNDTDATKSPMTMHADAHQTNYVSTPGNHVGQPELPVQSTTASWFLLTRVDVLARDSAGVIATLGDSITDGTASSIDDNRRWPDYLGRRLAATGQMRWGVLNVGIGGNRLLEDNAGVSALARFDRDVLLQSGVTHVIVLEGVNDIRRTTPPVTAEDLIAAHYQLIERAHMRGLTAFGATLTPFEGSVWTPENETKRQALNQWIRTSHSYDGVVDFDAALRDATHPTRLRPQYDSGDHIHPNDAGYSAMGDAINLDLFRVRRSATGR